MKWFTLVDHQTSARPSLGAHTHNREWQERNAVLGILPGAE
jgi:hypothetical protein